MKRHTRTLSELLLTARILKSKIQTSPFFSKRKHGLHTARFAYLHELSALHLTSQSPKTHVPIGRGAENAVLGLTPKRTRPELGNIAIFAPTRGGKGLDAIAKILTWQHSLIVNDIKGELYEGTAGYRAQIGDVFVLDPTGYGDHYDPYQGRHKAIDLAAAAALLIPSRGNGDNAIFPKRARMMQEAIAKGAAIEGYPVFPYMRELFSMGLDKALARLFQLSPQLVTKCLTVSFENADFTDRFLVHSWATLNIELDPLMTDTVVSLLSTSDFHAGDLLTAKRPITVYIRWPERYLLALSPLVRLLWGSFIDELLTRYHDRKGKGSQPVMLLIDEAARTAIPSLAEHASTVVGRNIILCMYFQTLAQIDAIYGATNATIILDNVDTQIFYRPNRSRKTTKTLEESLGPKSEYAHSETSRDGEETSESKSEQAIPLIPAHEITQMKDTDIIGFHRNLPPFRATRLDWRDFPELVRRHHITAPEVPELPPPEPLFETPDTGANGHYIDPNWSTRGTSEKE